MPYGYADSESGAILYPTLSGPTGLLSTAPQPGMRATASDAPGSMLFEVGGKWGGSLGHFASWGALPSVATLTDGACATIPQLVGNGRIRLIVEGARWAVAVGEVVARMADPFSVVSAADTAPVVFPLCTLPAGMIGNSEEWTFAIPVNTAANTSSDSLLPLLAGNPVSPGYTIPSQSNNPAQFSLRCPAVGSTVALARTFSVSILSARTSVTVDIAAPIAFSARYTPASVGNGISALYFLVRRDA